MLSVCFRGQDKRGAILRPGSRVVVVDTDGQAFDPVVNSGMGGVLEVSAFPRRTRQIKLQLMEGDRFLAEFIVPNPAARRDYPRWVPKSLPLSVKNGELAITLEKFLADQGRGATICLFSVRENGESSKEWEPATYEILDAAGNHWKAWPRNRATKTPQVVELFGALWPGEDAWLLRVEFKHRLTKAIRAVEFMARSEQVENSREIIKKWLTNERQNLGETDSKER